MADIGLSFCSGGVLDCFWGNHDLRIRIGLIHFSAYKSFVLLRREWVEGKEKRRERRKRGQVMCSIYINEKGHDGDMYTNELKKKKW